MYILYLYDAYTNFILSLSVLYIYNLKLPLKQKKRGRPRGSELTFIRLPKKNDGTVAFIRKHLKEKEKCLFCTTILTNFHQAPHIHPLPFLL